MSTNFVLRILCVAALLCVMSLPGLCATVSIPALAVVRGDRLLLVEVAQLDGTDDERAKLAAVVLGAAPQIGERRQFTLEMIRVRLRVHGFNPDALTLVCPQALEVTRLSTAVSGEVLVAAAQAWLLARMAPGSGEECELIPLRTPSEITVPMGDIRWECAATGTYAGPVRTVLVTLLADARPVWRGMIGFTVRRYASVLVTTVAIPRGKIVDPACVTRERREITQLKGVPVSDPETLRGTRAAVALSAGAIITAEAVEPIPLVRRNEPVRVTATCGSIVITTLAIACDDGAEGAVIRVRNTTTRQEYAVRVTGAGQASLVW